MTQIKLRRDTSANFTSKNPVLGIGEPAYETDTKKLKIGDGTTAYTQLEYFSAGGGGSTNITATLPLKIVDGVISLEVDGQTIQIVDGKLHANLDELTNEVNSLSGRVTTAEADVVNKEDKLTPVAPITINKYVKSNLHGFSFTTDGTGVYATSGKSLSYSSFDSQQQGRKIFENNTVISSADESWACYIDIPISLGQVVKFPVPDVENYYYPMLILGKIDATGHFTVITHGYALSNQQYNPTDDALVFNGNYVYTKAKSGYSATSSTTNIVHNQDPYTGFVQLFEDEAGTFSIQIHKCSGASNGIPNYCTRKYVISDASAINRFKEINTIRIVPCYYGTKNGKTAGSAISINSIGLYDCSTDLFSLNNDMSQFDTGNLFDISGETAHNYLELNLGDGLSVVDGKLTASSTAPTNMVTTDTTQTITGNKTFRYIGIDDAYGGKTRLGNGQSKIEMAYDGQISLDSATILADQSQNWRVGRYNKAGLIYSASPLKRVGDGPTFTNYDILDSSNLGSYVDGTTITYTNNKLSATGGGGSAPSNMVTTDTAQTITGDKEFTGITTISNDMKFTIGKKITTPDGQWLMQLGAGFIGIGTSIRPLQTYDGSNYYLHNKSVIAGDGIEIAEPSIGKIKISSTIGNMAAYVTEEFVDGTEGYRVWSNGRCEQWGSFNGIKSITFLKSYANTNYMILAYVTSKTPNEAYNGVFGTKKNATGFTTGGFAGTLNDAWIIEACGTVNWYTSGILAP